MNRPSRTHGFTLIELMIVVAIIGILAAIALPKFADLTRKSSEGATKGSLASLRSALSVYYSNMEGQYPQNLGVLTVSGTYLTALPTAKTPNYHPDSNAPLGGSQASFTTADLGRWYLDNGAGDANIGSVWIACSHTDSKGSVWTSY